MALCLGYTVWKKGFHIFISQAMALFFAKATFLDLVSGVQSLLKGLSLLKAGKVWKVVALGLMCAAQTLSKQILACEQSCHPTAVICQNENLKWYTTKLKPTHHVLRVKVNCKLRLHPTSWFDTNLSNCKYITFTLASSLHNEIEGPKKAMWLELTHICLRAVLMQRFHSFFLKVSGLA